MSELFLFRNALKDLLRPKRLVAAAVLAAVPLLIALIWRTAATNFQPEAAYNNLATGLIFGFVLVILSVVFCTDIIAQEIEQKTIVYLLTRPVPRWRIVLAKFAAAVLVTTVTVWISSVLLALVTCGPGAMGTSRLGRDLLILPLGALAYGTLFLLLATVINRPLTYGLLFAFGWESWVPNMPGDFQKLSLMSYLRVLAPHPKPEADSVDIFQMLSSSASQTISSPFAWTVLSCVITVALCLSLYIFSTREYVPREDAE